MTTENQIRIIKKYQNRRLYDTATSTYIVLEDIREIIINGELVQVIDVKTEQDVTRSVLLQIILEEEVNGIPMFSNNFLFQVVRFYGKTLQPSVSPFLEHGVDLFKKMQKQFYGQIKDSYGKDSYGKEKLFSGVELWHLWHEFFQQQSPQLEKIMKNYIKNNTNTFLEVQERFQQQTEQIFNCLQFPFNPQKRKK